MTDDDTPDVSRTFEALVTAGDAYEQANALLDAGRPDEARALLRGILADDPDDPEALVLTAWCLLCDGEAGEAAALAERVVARDPDDGRADLLRGLAYSALGEWARVEAAARAAIRADPTSAWGHALLAQALGREPATAAAAIEHAGISLLIAPDEASVVAVLARARLSQGDVDGARTEALRALALDPDDARARWVLAHAFGADPTLKARSNPPPGAALRRRIRDRRAVIVTLRVAWAALWFVSLGVGRTAESTSGRAAAACVAGTLLAVVLTPLWLTLGGTPRAMSRFARDNDGLALLAGFAPLVAAFEVAAYAGVPAVGVIARLLAVVGAMGALGARAVPARR